MDGSTPNVRLRSRIETLIALIAPMLDLVLAAADRVSRVLEPDDPDYAPARMAYEGESVPRGLPRRPGQGTTEPSSRG